MCIAQFIKVGVLKKIRLVTLIGRVKKMPKKGRKDVKKNVCFNQIYNFDTCSSSIFKGFFKTLISRSVALVTKKLWAIIVFFYTDRTFYRPVYYPMH